MPTYVFFLLLILKLQIINTITIAASITTPTLPRTKGKIKFDDCSGSWFTVDFVVGGKEVVVVVEAVVDLAVDVAAVDVVSVEVFAVDVVAVAFVVAAFVVVVFVVVDDVVVFRAGAAECIKYWIKAFEPRVTRFHALI